MLRIRAKLWLNSSRFVNADGVARKPIATPSSMPMARRRGRITRRAWAARSILSDAGAGRAASSLSPCKTCKLKRAPADDQKYQQEQQSSHSPCAGDLRCKRTSHGRTMTWPFSGAARPKRRRAISFEPIRRSQSRQLDFQFAILLLQTALAICSWWRARIPYGQPANATKHGPARYRAA